MPLIAGASTAAAAGVGVCWSVGVSLKVGAVELSAMAELDPFGVPAGGPALGNGVAGEEDPAAAFLAQQESEIAGIENDEAFAILDGGAPGSQPHGEPPGIPGKCGCFRGGSAAPETRPTVGLRALCNSCASPSGRLSAKRKRAPGPVIRKPRLGRLSPSKECV